MRARGGEGDAQRSACARTGTIDLWRAGRHHKARRTRTAPSREWRNDDDSVTPSHAAATYPPVLLACEAAANFDPTFLLAGLRSVATRARVSHATRRDGRTCLQETQRPQPAVATHGLVVAAAICAAATAGPVWPPSSPARSECCPLCKYVPFFPSFSPPPLSSSSFSSSSSARRSSCRRRRRRRRRPSSSSPRRAR